MNKILDSLIKEDNIKETENDGIALKSTLDKVYDLFAFGGAYRSRTNTDCILLFKNALEENEELALKCLFYLRAIRDGQGERRFFRVCFKWLCNERPDAAIRNLDFISALARWDDLLYATEGTKVEYIALEKFAKQLLLDNECETPSLAGKWAPSCNASSHKTITMAHKVRKFMKMSNKEYRKLLSSLRTKINIVEKLMSENRWVDIQFDKIPSQAGLKYKNAFARRDLIAKKYEEFAKDKTTKVNAAALYPYEVVKRALDIIPRWYYQEEELALDNVDRLMINKYWENLKDYIGDSDMSAICVCDTSGSMESSYGTSIRPIDVAISLSLYMAERNKGDFKDYYISFASRPQLIKTEGVDFVDKVKRIYQTNLVDNTNLDAVFDLLKNKALENNGVNKDDLPKTIIVISDMEIDEGAKDYSWQTEDSFNSWNSKNIDTNMQRIRKEWAAAGLKLPKIVYWNVCARNNTILDSGENISFVSGASPVLFEQICKGVTGKEIMMEKLLSEPFKDIK